MAGFRPLPSWSSSLLLMAAQGALPPARALRITAYLGLLSDDMRSLSSSRASEEAALITSSRSLRPPVT
ncbi:MAG: hypothetical protein GU352_03995 [Acidilobus sp.]|nr:hypothetical protein [Acidilobus sp.]